METEENYDKKTSGRIAGLWVEIWTQYLPRMKHVCYLHDRDVQAGFCPHNQNLFTAEVII
jgi:hypothetical protein